MAEAVETQTQEEAQLPTETQAEVVEKARLDDALGDLHKWKAKAKELEKSHEEAKLNRMKEQQEWQKIAELKEQEAHEARSDAENTKTLYLNDRKIQSVREAARAAGIRDEALQDLDLVGLDDVAIETTSTGRVNVLGAQQMISKLKATRPHWFGSGKAPNVNTADPSVNLGGEVAVSQILEAQKAGNTQLYVELTRKYQEQRKK